MKVRLIFGVCVMIALFALGSASAKNPADSSNDYLALGDSLVFAFIDQAGYEYYYPTNFVGICRLHRLNIELETSGCGLSGRDEWQLSIADRAR